MSPPPSSEEQRDRPRLIKMIRTGIQRFQIAVYLLVIVCVAIVINLFNNMFTGVGPGGDNLISIDHPKGQQTTEVTLVDDLLKKEKENASTMSVVEVLVNDNTLLLVTIVKGQKTEKAISLEDLIEKVKQAPGNSHGIKIKVLQKSSARKVTRDKLIHALDKANIGTEAQLWPDKFVDEIVP